MRILLLGGTGAMGMYLTVLLEADGHDVFVTSRSSMHKDRNRVTYIKGNAHDKSFLTQILSEKYDAIVDFMIYSNEELSDRAHLLLSSTNQYFFLSSSRVYVPNILSADEDAPLMIDQESGIFDIQSNYYSIYKAQQERILKDTGLDNYTIIRPYITYSDNRIPLGILEKEDWLYRALHGRTIVFSEVIRDKQTTLTCGLDVSRGIIALLGKKEALGQAYHITASSSIKWSEVLEVYLSSICEITGKRPKVIYAKDNYMMVWGWIDQALNDRYYDRTFSNAKIAKYLDVNSFMEPKEGLKDCITNFLRNPRFKEIHWSYEGKRDRIAHEWTPLKEIPSVKSKIKYLVCRLGLK